jgi:hypothetical protein
MAPKKDKLGKSGGKMVKSSLKRKVKGCKVVVKKLAKVAEEDGSDAVSNSQATSVGSMESVCSEGARGKAGARSSSVEKRRGDNWQKDELRTLLDFCKDNIDFIEGDFNPRLTRDIRRAKWDSLTERLNA